MFDSRVQVPMYQAGVLTSSHRLWDTLPSPPAWCVMVSQTCLGQLVFGWREGEL